MSNKDKAQYIRVLNFNEEANSVINKAIQFSDAENYSEVNLNHIFLALIENSKLGSRIMECLDISFDKIYEAYKSLKHPDKMNADKKINLYDLDNLSKDAFILLGRCTHNSIIYNEAVSVDDMFAEFIESGSSEVDILFDKINVTYELLYNIQHSEVMIPERLQDFLVDMNEDVALMNECITGVDEYTDELCNILCRKLKANPCLIGEAGVGKTTIVRALVQRILEGRVPDMLLNVHIIYINSAMLTAGTRFRGDLEERMKAIVDWATQTNVILFLDEIHTFTNIGKSSGESTPGNMIKQALADGTLAIIGATTTKEYHKYVETDSAFDRRLQIVEVKEPSVEDAITLVSGSIKNYEEYHSVEIPNEVTKTAVELSDRYIKNKCLPDKAFTIIDQAATNTSLANRSIVTEDDVLKVVSKISGVDITKLTESESTKLINLENTLSKNIIGQKNAINTVSKAIRRSKAGVREENKPIASLLFVGPTGVGKTELCKVLSKEVAIGNVSFIKVDMSEYSEKYSISKMIGTAPGYIGYGEGGQLTEKVKHNPYSLVLFDEIEKAHPDVFNTFLQLMDEGRLTDGEGNTIDFTNCIVVMTSNAGYGADQFGKTAIGFSSDESKSVNDAKEREKVAKKALETTFKPEFLNRLDNIVIFDKLTEDECKDITKLMLNKLAERLSKKEISIKFDKTVVDNITNNGFSEKYGARNLRREIQDDLEDLLANEILTGHLSKGAKATVKYSKKLGYRVCITNKE